MIKFSKRISVVLSILLLIIFLAAGEAQQQQQTNQEHGKMKALFIWGGWPGHEPGKCRDIFVPWLRDQGFEVRVDSTLDVYTDSVYMASSDLIVQIMTMSEISNNSSIDGYDYNWSLNSAA